MAELNTVATSAEVSQLAAKIANLEAKNAELDARIANLEMRHRNTEAKNAEIEAKIAELEAKFAKFSLTNDIAAIQSQIDEIKVTLQAVVDKSPELDYTIARIAYLEMGLGVRERK
jgi:chromosome segregation ATPase